LRSFLLETVSQIKQETLFTGCALKKEEGVFMVPAVSKSALGFRQLFRRIG
jgi:hypothetical protein